MDMEMWSDISLNTMLMLMRKVCRPLVFYPPTTDVVQNQTRMATALALAAWKGHLDVVRYLIEQSANVNAKNAIIPYPTVEMLIVPWKTAIVMQGMC
jgi:hypothetical protein